MILQEKEKNLLYKVVALGVVLVALPVVMQDYADAYLQQGQVQERALRQDVGKLQERLANVDSERDLLLRYRDNYNIWQERGAIDKQDPVVWVKMMDRIKKERRFFDVEFNFAEENELGAEDSLYTKDSTVAIKFLEMNIDMPMLHDLDIFMFLESLEEEVDALFFPTSCTLTKIEDTFELVQRQNMHGSCTVNWLSVSDPERNQPQTAAAESGG